MSIIDWTDQQLPREDHIRQRRAKTNHDDLAEEHQEVGNPGEDGQSGHVPQEEEEGVLGRGAEVVAGDGTHDVGVAVEELHELLQTPETTLTATHQALYDDIVLVILGQLLLHLLQNDADHSENGDDKRTKGHSA